MTFDESRLAAYAFVGVERASYGGKKGGRKGCLSVCPHFNRTSAEKADVYQKSQNRRHLRPRAAGLKVIFSQCHGIDFGSCLPLIKTNHPATPWSPCRAHAPGIAAQLIAQQLLRHA